MSSSPSKQIVPILLAVPYGKKDHFKQKYGRQFLWNPEGKFWYWFSEAALPDDLQPFLPPTSGTSKEKQPASSEPKLTLELIPKTCWASGVRKQMTREQWDAVRKHTYSIAHYFCEICGGKGDTWPVGCHETYQYDEVTKIQTLLGFRALCPTCFLVKQYGRAQSQGMERAAFAHLRKVNGWSESQAREYVDSQFDLWARRSRIKWAMDFSYLERHFGIVIEVEDIDQRHDRAVSFYEQKLGEYRETHPEEDLWTEMTTEHGLYAKTPSSVPPALPPPIPDPSPSLLRRLFGFLLPKSKP